jgi:hypothetical protein
MLADPKEVRQWRKNKRELLFGSTENVITQLIKVITRTNVQ